MGVVEWEMAGISRKDSGVGSSTEGFSSGQQLCESGEALAEWRSSEQLENGTPSTSPPYWDTDDDDDFGRLFVSRSLMCYFSLFLPIYLQDIKEQ